MNYQSTKNKTEVIDIITKKINLLSPDILLSIEQREEFQQKLECKESNIINSTNS